MDQRDVADLEAGLQEIWDTAAQLGLDPYPVHFEVVPAPIMHEFGAYGLPGRFSHWTYGRAYQQLKTLYDYGLSKIYELVINTNPAYAFLVDTNSVLQNKVVVAHVLGHVDFFKHNAYFQLTNRQMLEGASVNAERIRQYEFRHGSREVESFLDAVLSIQEHVEFSVRRRSTPTAAGSRRPAPARETPYDDLFYVGSERPPEPAAAPHQVPREPERDLLLFIAEHARGLEDWQLDVVHIVRAEQLYFRPQMMTKIINEGWAAFCHARIMRAMDLSASDHLEFSRMHASVLSPSRRQLNPYYLGMKLFEDIERRWDSDKVKEVRELESDVSFLRNYLTAELVEELDLYLYERKGNEWVVVDKDWEKVRDSLTRALTNFGQPYIVVKDGDFKSNGELYLEHFFEGQELEIPYATRTLEQVFRLWGRTVHLATQLGEKSAVLSFDGREHTRK
ncbi:MAG: SpoVR family protein [Chloroflexi bacterium]|nr:MAG: SpoVR family protein [Chloroflexota bacterium]